MAPTDKKTAFRALMELKERPNALRTLLTGLMLLVGYLGVYTPLSARIDETTLQLDKERKRQELCSQVECLRAQVDRFRSRLPGKTDSNEWVQYVLGGIRKLPLKMLALNSGVPQRLGPYEAVVLKLELEGGFRDLDAFLHWVETNQRLFRVDALKIAPGRGDDSRLVMQMTLLGLGG
jgi:Tfp pilus assembly protein PilO